MIWFSIKIYKIGVALGYKHLCCDFELTYLLWLVLYIACFHVSSILKLDYTICSKWLWTTCLYTVAQVHTIHAVTYYLKDLRKSFCNLGSLESCWHFFLEFKYIWTLLVQQFHNLGWFSNLLFRISLRLCSFLLIMVANLIWIWGCWQHQFSWIGIQYWLHCNRLFHLSFVSKQIHLIVYEQEPSVWFLLLFQFVAKYLQLYW